MILNDDSRIADLESWASDELVVKEFSVVIMVPGGVLSRAEHKFPINIKLHRLIHILLAS